MGVACTLNGQRLPIDPCGSVRQESASERFGRGDYVQVPHLEIRVPMAHAFLRAFSRAPALCRSLCLATTARARPRSLREDDRPRVS